MLKPNPENYNKIKKYNENPVYHILWQTLSALSTNWMHNPHFWVIISYCFRLHLCVKLFLKVEFVFPEELECQLACSINITQLSNSIMKCKKHQGNRNHSFCQFHSLSNLKLRFRRDPPDYLGWSIFWYRVKNKVLFWVQSCLLQSSELFTTADI